MKPPFDPPTPPPVRAARTTIVLIVLTSGIGPFALNMPLPSMPSIAAALDTSYGRAQLVLTLFFVALAVGQFIYGPLSDRIGRRPAMIAGLLVFVAGSAISAAASDIDMLLAGRVIQGLGGCAGMVLGRAMLSDLYGRDRAASLIGYVTVAVIAAPMIAPALGGLLDQVAGWRTVFAVLGALGLVLLAATAALLPETRPERHAAGEGAGALLLDCLSLLATPAFVAFGVVMMFTSAMFFSFLAGAPYVVVELMGRGPIEYGLWHTLTAMAYMLGNFISGRHAGRAGAAPLMRWGTILLVLGSALLVASVAFAPLVPPALFLPMMIVTFSHGLLLPSAIASAITVRPDLAGAASGLSGALQMGVSAVATVAVAGSLADTPAPMIVAIIVCGLASVGGYLAARRYQ